MRRVSLVCGPPLQWRAGAVAAGCGAPL